MVDFSEIYLPCLSFKEVIVFEDYKRYSEEKISYVPFKFYKVCVVFHLSAFLIIWFRWFLANKKMRRFQYEGNSKDNMHLRRSQIRTKICPTLMEPILMMISMSMIKYKSELTMTLLILMMKIITVPWNVTWKKFPKK